MFDSEVSAGPISRPPKGDWEKWFAWYPVQVKGKHRWLTSIYRRVGMYREDMNIYVGYEYGDLFDVLKDES
jgi:hypothetical protein